MKKILAGILTITSLSSYADVYGTSFQNSYSSQELITTCSEGYKEASEKIQKHWDRLQNVDEYMSAFALPGVLVVALAVGSPLVLLTPLAYVGASEVMQNKYEGIHYAEVLYQASQKCQENGSCEGVEGLNVLQDVQKYLKKKGADLSNEEIADFVLTEGQDLDFCTKKIKKKGVRVLKPYRTLKKEILKGVRS